MLKFNRPILTIFGGMGPMAGVELHKKILFNTDAKRDQDHAHIQHICFPSIIDDRTKYLQSLDGVNPGSQAAQLFRSLTLNSSHKYIVGIPCNTFHSPIIFNLFQNIISIINQIFIL